MSHDDNLVIEEPATYPEIARDMYDAADAYCQTPWPWMAVVPMFAMLTGVEYLTDGVSVGLAVEIAVVIYCTYFLVKFWGQTA